MYHSSAVGTTGPGTSRPLAQVKPAVEMVYCTYCGKAFTRKEHLERHIPSRKQPPMPPDTTHFGLLTTRW